MNFNSFISWVLRSPLHPMVSGGMLLITVTGRKTGKRYTTPVQYLRQGDIMWVTSTRQRTWWRNLRGGAEVTLRLRGKDVNAQAEALEDEMAVAEGFRTYFQLAPNSVRYFHVKLDSTGKPEAGDIAELARQRVVIRLHPGG